MSLNIDDAIKHEAFAHLKPSQIDGLKDVLKRAAGKSTLEAVPILVGFAKTLQNAEPIPPETQKAMLEAILSTMPEAEREKFKAMLRMMENMKLQ